MGNFQINAPTVVHETIDEEVVIINLDKGDYYSLVNTGTEIWNAITQGLSTDSIFQIIVERYEGEIDTIQTAIQDFINQLQQEELIVAAEEENNTNPPAPQTPTTKDEFAPPMLQKYSDMQDLLLLDPIHEVDESGWPNAKV
ncbi:MAG: PqqD family protein [Oscillatoria sp. PMC 1076.18]|nr:PqqD family protein [Oscillatoria sp. PMC 1076.18]